MKPTYGYEVDPEKFADLLETVADEIRSGNSSLYGFDVGFCVDAEDLITVEVDLDVMATQKILDDAEGVWSDV